MPIASRLRTLSNYEPDKAREVILDALARNNGVRKEAARDLREACYLPTDGDRAPTTLNEIVTALGMGDEIRKLYPQHAAGNDAEIARDAGVSRQAIGYRRTHGLPLHAPREVLSNEQLIEKLRGGWVNREAKTKAKKEERSARAKAAWVKRRASPAEIVPSEQQEAAS
jgi:hypothetical protein